MQSDKTEPMQSFTRVNYLRFTLLSILFILLLHHFFQYLMYAFSLIIYPFELDYGEGIIWQQALLIPGERMYGDIHRYPFIVFHYTPLYHFVVKIIASLGIDYLVVGRGLSVLSTVAIAVLVCLLTVRAMTGTKERYIALLAGLVAALTVFTYRPVIDWSPLMRVDMLAIALSFLGVYLAVRSIGRPALLYGAMLSFVAALYTKQTALAAPVAASAVLLLVQPKQTMKAIGFGLVVALSAFLYLNWTTEGRFIKHILQYNVNRFSLARFVLLTREEIVEHFIYLLITTITLFTSWRWIFLQDIKPGYVTALREKLITQGNILLLTVLTVYFMLASILLILVGKSGSYINYFIEWMCIWSVIIGLAVGYALQLAGRPGYAQSTSLRGVVGIGLPMALMCQVLLMPMSYGRSPPPMTNQQMGELLDKIRTARKPVLSEDMVLLLKAGKEVPLELAIFAELASVGQWDEQRFVELIRIRYFEFVVTEGLASERYTLSMREAIKAAYPKKEKFGSYQLYLPSE